MAKRKGGVHKVCKANPQHPGKQKFVTKKRQNHTEGGNRSLGSTVFYDEYQRILCVGEGNFSFARALARNFEGQGQLLTATAYDTKETVWEKYEVSSRVRLGHSRFNYGLVGHLTTSGLQEGSDPVSEIVEELQGCDAAVYFAVDATQIVKTLKVRRAAHMFGSKRLICNQSPLILSIATVSRALSWILHTLPEVEQASRVAASMITSLLLLFTPLACIHSCVFMQSAKNRQRAQHLPDAFDRIIFNFPHIGLGIKDQVM